MICTGPEMSLRVRLPSSQRSSNSSIDGSTVSVKWKERRKAVRCSRVISYVTALDTNGSL
eukprot:5062446-Pleurochrysis_carterae.AAC.1